VATSDSQPKPAQPRVSSGAVFFDSDDRLLLVKPTYKDGWNLAGGAVDTGETPREACVREVREELGIEPPIGPLLLTAWTRSPDMGDKIFFVFDGGILDPHDQAAITLDQQELEEHSFFTHADAAQALPSWLANLVANAIESRINGNPQYIELSLTPKTEPPCQT
jgi:8-oxo-dGTP diphosphatase